MPTEKAGHAPPEADLVWNVRDSFRRYVEGVGGTVEVIPPATLTPSGQIRFPVAQTTPEATQFTGGLTFTAHHGALNVSFRDPRLERAAHDPGATVLSVVDASRDDPSRIVLATIDATGAVALATEGVAVFDFHYAAGTALDPIEFAPIEFSGTHR